MLGGIGGETAVALARHGWQIRALVCDPRIDAARRQPNWEWVRGDALDAATVARAALRAAFLVHAVNPPGYKGWAKLGLPMIDHTVAAVPWPALPT